MSLTLNDVLGYQTILGVADKILGGLPTTHMPPGLLGDGTTKRAVEGDTGLIIRGEGTQRTAKQAMRGSPSRPVTVSGISARPQVLIHSSNNMEIKTTDVMNLLDSNETRQQLGRQEIARRQREAAVRSQNLRTAAVTSAFALGKIHFDSDGELLPSSSGAAITVDYGIPAGNQNQVGGIIDASWATATTKMLRHLELINQHSIQTNGRALTNAMYGSNIFSYILDGAQTKELIYRNAAANSAALGEGRISFTLAGMKWWPGYSGFYKDAGGTNRTFLGPDQIVFFPDPDPSWYEMQEGFEPIPTSGFGIADSFEAAMSNLTMRQGIFQYTVGQNDPVGAKLVFGDNFLPAIHVPEAVYIVDVTP